MSQYFLDGHDLSNLFEGDPISFKDKPEDYIHGNVSLIYSIWDSENRFIYVGISGIQKDPEKRKPVSRINKHRSGRRSGNQFCIYVHDRYVIPDIINAGNPYEYKKGHLDKLTRQHIRDHFSYRFVKFPQKNGAKIVTSLEKKIKSGVIGIFPVLNGSDDKLTKQMALPV